MEALFFLITKVLDIYLFFILVWIIMGWLLAFGVLPTYNPIVLNIMNFLYKVTEPALSKIRQFVPVIGGIDLSTLILILFIYAAQIFITRDLANFFGVGY
ncbi:MAG: YggT family protein [Sphingomonadales bacterium]|jgi:YggT family protein